MASICRRKSGDGKTVSPPWPKPKPGSPALPENATPLQTMAHRLKTKAGRALYALRKQTVEPRPENRKYGQKTGKTTPRFS
jgi:hypothetical protein